MAPDTPAGPRSSRPIVVAGTGVIAVTYGLVRFGYGLYLPSFRADFALSSTLAGGIAAGSFAGYCAAALVAERLIAGGRSRLALWTACGLAVAGALTVAGAWSPASLAAGVVVGGSAAGAASPALVAIVGATVPASVVDRAQAVVNSGTSAGVVVGGLVAAMLAGQWRVTWAAFAVAAVLVTRSVDRRAAWPDPRAGLARPGWSWADLGALRPALLAAWLAGAGSAAVWTFGRDLLGDAGRLPPSTTALLWCVLGGAGALGALSGDLVRGLGLRRAWTATAAVTAASTVLLGCAPGVVPLAAIALAAYGGGYVALSGVLIAWGARLTPDRAAGATAALFLALTAGQALGSAAVGLIAVRSSLTAGFVAAACLLLLSSVAASRPRGIPGRPRVRRVRTTPYSPL